MLKLAEIVEFKTKNQEYVYDSITSRVINTTEVQTFLIKNFFSEENNYISIKNKFDITEKEYNQIRSYISSLIYKYNMFYYEEGKDIKNELIVNELKELTYDSPLSQLILIMTDNCNLRCEYCIYSDKYPKDIEYSRRKMDFNTAKLSIDKYFELHKERKKHGLNKSANISFYGGEPLLNFDLIKKSVEYIKKIEPETIFYITTNGTIMNDEIARFFATNNFIVTFSLDGYKENHDRNRIFIDRRKSFDTVIKNIKKLKAVKNELGDNNPISFNCCFDLYTDLEKVVYFFEENYHEFAPFFITYAPIKKVDTTYYEWCDKRYLNDTEFKKGTLYESKRKLENKLFYKNEFSTEFKEVAASLFLGELTFYIRNKNHNIGILRNSCLPLSKMTVTPDGKIVLCEKMCEKFPVGHVNEGIDWNKLCDITNALIRFFNSDKCRKCKVRAMCEACFMYLDSNGMISEDFCNEKITNFEKELEHHYKLYEDRVNILDVLKDNRDNILKVQEVSK